MQLYTLNIQIQGLSALKDLIVYQGATIHCNEEGLDFILEGLGATK